MKPVVNKRPKAFGISKSDDKIIRKYLFSVAGKVVVIILNCLDKHNIVHLEDWRLVSPKYLTRLQRPLVKYGGLFKLLQNYYPEYKWTKRPPTSRTGRIKLLKALRDLFPYNTISNFRVRKSVTLDVFLDSVKIGFQYRDPRYYHWNCYDGNPNVDEQQQQDQLTKDVCSKEGITLVTVPYWWTGDMWPLLATIQQVKPAILQYTNIYHNFMEVFNTGMDNATPGNVFATSHYAQYITLTKTGMQLTCDAISPNPPSATITHKFAVKTRAWSLAEQKKRIDQVATGLGITQPQDWYTVSWTSLLRTDETLMPMARLYHRSMEDTLKSIYRDANGQPVYDWKEWLFPVLPQYFWSNPANHRRYFDWIQQELHMKDHSDWYGVTREEIITRRGASLLIHYYNDSLIEALLAVYPEHPWRMWLFKQVPAGWWKEMAHQKQFTEWLQNERNMKTLDDWYQVTVNQVRQYGGNTLLKIYGDSLFKCLQTIYPHHTWIPWKFHQVPADYWRNMSHIRRYIDWVGTQLGITTLDDWYSVREDKLPKFVSIKRQFGSLLKVLQSVYPDHPWGQLQDQPFISKSQLSMRRILKRVLPPTISVLMNHRMKNIVFSETNRAMEFDVFIPQLRLALEYQGEQHYQHHYLYGAPQALQLRDLEKRHVCKTNGIDLIAIPFWWDGTAPSLVATIIQERPDIQKILTVIPAPGVPIPKTLPPDIKPKFNASRFISKEQLAKTRYTVALGTPRSYPKCRSCSRLLKNPEEPRMIVKGGYTAQDGTIYVVNYHVCLKDSCMENAIHTFAQKRKGIDRVHFPPFDGKVEVNGNLLQAVHKKLADGALGSKMVIKDIEWLTM